MLVWDAVVLAGGQGRRLGGADKPALVVGGQTLLDSALDAVTAARHTVVVGPSRPVRRPVRWAREDPAGGGPLAALAAGITALPPGSDAVAVLAADLPAVSADAVQSLVQNLAGDGVVAVDASGRRQPLLAVYRMQALDQALAEIGDPHSQPMRLLAGKLTLAEVDVGCATDDIDTPGDLARWQEGRL